MPNQEKATPSLIALAFNDNTCSVIQGFKQCGSALNRWPSAAACTCFLMQPFNPPERIGPASVTWRANGTERVGAVHSYPHRNERRFPSWPVRPFQSSLHPLMMLVAAICIQPTACENHVLHPDFCWVLFSIFLLIFVLAFSCWFLLVFLAFSCLFFVGFLHCSVRRCRGESFSCVLSPRLEGYWCAASATSLSS